MTMRSRAHATAMSAQPATARRNNATTSTSFTRAYSNNSGGASDECDAIQPAKRVARSFEILVQRVARLHRVPASSPHASAHAQFCPSTTHTAQVCPRLVRHLSRIKPPHQSMQTHHHRIQTLAPWIQETPSPTQDTTTTRWFRHIQRGAKESRIRCFFCPTLDTFRVCDALW